MNCELKHQGAYETLGSTGIKHKGIQQLLLLLLLLPPPLLLVLLPGFILVFSPHFRDIQIFVFPSFPLVFHGGHWFRR